ncbi:MAG: hypothetical protein EXQ91_04305 [Alphaproteobacteria bacterium]|nr:hypothetical protein [Alphaproteobacteria bacterium]
MRSRAPWLANSTPISPSSSPTSATRSKALRPRPLMADNIGSMPSLSGSSHEGGEDWLMSYADFVTVLVGFFVPMYSVSDPTQAKLSEVAESFSNALGGKATQQVQPFMSIVQQAPSSLSTWDKDAKNEVTGSQRGVTFDFKAASIFKGASAEILPEGVPQLDRVAQLISFMGNTNYKITSKATPTTHPWPEADHTRRIGSSRPRAPPMSSNF